VVGVVGVLLGCGAFCFSFLFVCWWGGGGGC